MNRLILTIGAPRSGKTTWADNFIKESNDSSKWAIVNRDDIRRELFGFSSWSEYKFTNAKEQTVTEVQFAAMEKYAEEGKHIICTDTNLSVKTRNKFTKWAMENGYELEYKHFNVPLHVLEQRNADSAYGVSPTVLLDMWLRYEKEFGNGTYVGDLSKPKAIIVDIDGTLAKMNGRSPYEWDKVNTDLVNHMVAKVVNQLSFDHKIIIMSGRDSVAIESTTQWLISTACVSFDRLMMRSAGDGRPDHIVKKELFDQIRNEYNIVMAIDDRDSIVNLWRSMGIQCWQVDYGKF